MPSAEELADLRDNGQKGSDGELSKGTASQPKMTREARKKPPPETKEAVWLRTKVILSFWAIIVFVGLPVWWETTSIYRARLPRQEMLGWSEGSVCAVFLLLPSPSPS